MTSPITKARFLRIVHELGDIGREDIKWAQSVGRPVSPEDMALEIAFVICNSGMKNTVARRIFDKVSNALVNDRFAVDVFGHQGKAKAIDRIWYFRGRYYAQFMALETDNARLDWCASLPWIGPITKYHVAKNFGVDLAKPDVHLQRLADNEGTTAQALCERLARETGYRVATVDTILWRACANGVLNSRNGHIGSAI